MFKARNVIEAGVLAVAIGLPVFYLPLSLTARIIILCLTALPLALVALMGISGESLSSFILIFFKYLRHRRVIEPEKEEADAPAPRGLKKLFQKRKKKRTAKEATTERKTTAHPKVAERKATRRRIKNKRKKATEPEAEAAKENETAKEKADTGDTGETSVTEENAKETADKPTKQNKLFQKLQSKVKHEPPESNYFPCLNPVAEYLPIDKIENGIIYTKDHRYVKVVEIVPINFLLRSAREQRNIIYSFISYLKISPVKLQFKVLTRKADTGRHMEAVRRDMETETNGQCRLMQEDYLRFVQQIGSREAVTRRFFLIFEFEPWYNTRRTDEESEAVASLQSAVHTASNYLRQCGNEVLIPENEDEFTVDVLYNLLCRNESVLKPLSHRVREITEKYWEKGLTDNTKLIPSAEFFAPQRIDFTHGSYICIDGLYYAYLLVPADGYATQVPA